MLQRYLAWDSFGVKEDFIRLREGLTRINVKVKASDEETEINGRGPIISDDELEALYKQLDALTEKDTLILAGSIPSSLPSDMYELIMERLQHKNIRIVVDATKDLLTRVLPINRSWLNLTIMSLAKSLVAPFLQRRTS